jgi:hypothetical protein
MFIGKEPLVMEIAIRVFELASRNVPR